MSEMEHWMDEVIEAEDDQRLKKEKREKEKMEKGTKKTTDQKKPYANATRAYEGRGVPPSGQGYQFSPGQNYSDLAKKLFGGKEQEFCLACLQSGQPCSKHMKADIPIVDISDIFGDFPVGEKNIDEQNKMYHQGVATKIAYAIDQLPYSYTTAKKILREAGAYHAKLGGLDEKVFSYSQASAGKSYAKSSASAGYKGK